MGSIECPEPDPSKPMSLYFYSAAWLSIQISLKLEQDSNQRPLDSNERTQATTLSSMSLCIWLVLTEKRPFGRVNNGALSVVDGFGCQY